MIPNHLHSRYVEAFFGSVHIAKCRTKRNHVEVRIALGEETTLKACVNTLYFRILAEELLVSIDSQLCQLAIGLLITLLRCDARISILSS